MNRSRLDWDCVPLSRWAIVQTGIAKNQSLTGDTVERPYLRVANVQEGFLDLSEIKVIRLPRNKESRYQLRFGDVLFTEGGDFDKLGRCCVWRGEIDDCLHQNHVFAVRTDPKHLLPDFLALVAESNHGKKYFLKCSKKSTNLASINSTQLKALPIPKTPVAVQKAIVGIAHAFDQLCTNLSTELELHKRRKFGLVQELFDGRRRFSKFVAPYEDVALSELFSERVDRDNDNLELLSVTANNGIVSRDSLGRKDTSTQDKSSYKRVVPGDIAYNTMRMWQGVSALVVREGIVSPAYTVVTPKRLISAKYAARLFKSPRVIHQFLRYSQGLVDDTLNLKFHHFSEVRVRIPEISEQYRIVELLELIDAEIGLLSQQRLAIEKQKRGVMERLLSGEVAIPADIVDRLSSDVEEVTRIKARDAKLPKLANKSGS